MTAAAATGPNAPEIKLELPAGADAPGPAPAPSPRARVSAVLTPERVKFLTPIALALAAGLFLGIRLGQHLRGLGGADAVPGSPGPAPYDGPQIVVEPQHAADCAECAQRATRSHVANQEALRQHPLEPGTVLFDQLSPEERAQVEIRLAQMAAGTAPVGPDGEAIITVGTAPPIHDVP